MPLIVPITDPYSGEPRPAAWAWCRISNFDHGAKVGYLEYEVYASAAAAYSQPPLPPCLTLALHIKPERQPAVYGPPPLISPYVPPVVIRDPGTNGPDDPGEMTPAVDPVYGPAPLLRPEIPSFDEMLAANATAYGLLQRAVDQLAIDSIPELSAGVIEGS